MRPVERCLLCDVPLAPRFSAVRDPGSEEHFQVLRCPECGLGHTSPVPSDLGRYYGATYYGGRHGITERLCLARRARILEGASAGRRGALLDVGCGEGTFITAMAAGGWSGSGVEIGRAAEIARDRGVTVHPTLAAAASGAPYAAVTLWHSLEHLPSPLEALAAVRAMMTPEATLIVAVPDAGGWQARGFGARWAHLDPPRHLFHFDTGSLSRVLERCRFGVERLLHQELEYDLFGWIQSASNLILDEPNVLYTRLTRGRAPGRGAREVAALALGAVLAPAALAATWAGSAAGRGGTLIAVARPR